MEKELIICDTNVFIHFLNNDEKTIQILENIGLENVAMSTVTAMELLQGMGNKIELKKMQKVIKQYHIIGFNEEIAQLALELTAKYSLSHHLQILIVLLGQPPLF